jgi:hypothetical protein
MKTISRIPLSLRAEFFRRTMLGHFLDYTQSLICPLSRIKLLHFGCVTSRGTTVAIGLCKKEERGQGEGKRKDGIGAIRSSTSLLSALESILGY